MNKPQKFFKFNYEVSIRDIVLLLSIICAILGWAHKMVVNDAKADMQYNMLCDRISALENDIVPRILKIVETHKNKTEDRLKEQDKKLLVLEKDINKMDIIIHDIKNLDSKIDDLLDGKYKLK